MKLSVFLAVLLLSGCTTEVKSQVESIEGTWIVTKCLSNDPNDQRVSNEEIGRNLGGEMVISRSIITNLSQVRDTCFGAKITIESKNVKSYFDDPKYPELLGLNKATTVQIAKTNCGYYLSEFYVLDAKTVVVSVDGFLLFFDKRNDASTSASVIADKLAFYSDSSLEGKLDYYTVKGDVVSIFLKRNNSYFIKYSGKRRDYYGWVNAAQIR